MSTADEIAAAFERVDELLLAATAAAPAVALLAARAAERGITEARLANHLHIGNPTVLRWVLRLEPATAAATAALLAGAQIPSSTAMAGDMGRADIQTRNDLPLKSDFNAQCVGPMDRWEGPECVVRFDGARMTVDGSKGITREQVKGLAFHWGSDVRKYVDVVYVTADEKVSIAQFGFRYGNVAKQFIHALVRFMGGDAKP